MPELSHTCELFAAKKAALSIIVPTLDEAATIAGCLENLAPLRRRGTEVIVADGGSLDATREISGPQSDRVIIAPRGRASQMNAAARLASGDVLLFLHADTKLPDGADKIVLERLMRLASVWGRFDVQILPSHPLLTIVAWMMNWRSRVFGIATGDQAIFITKTAFDAVGGYPDIPLMEDIALCRKLRRRCKPICIHAKAITSGRRWLSRGILRTVFLMWRLRFVYYFGADPHGLARRYGYEPRDH